jgi:hypothetical protein
VGCISSQGPCCHVHCNLSSGIEPVGIPDSCIPILLCRKTDGNGQSTHTEHKPNCAITCSPYHCRYGRCWSHETVPNSHLCSIPSLCLPCRSASAVLGKCLPLFPCLAFQIFQMFHTHRQAVNRQSVPRRPSTLRQPWRAPHSAHFDPLRRRPTDAMTDLVADPVLFLARRRRQASPHYLPFSMPITTCSCR